MKNFMESTICLQVGKLMANKAYAWNDRCTEVSIKTLIEGMAVYLGRNKSKDKVVVAELRDAQDKFHFAMKVQYLKQDEDGADEGSWALTMTFDEKDIDYENSAVAKYPEDQVLAGIIYDIGYSRYGAFFKFQDKDNNNEVCEGSPQELLCTCIDGVADYMRANVSVDPVLEMENYFTATAKLEGDGSIYIGMEPSALMKQHIKDDSSIDKKAA